MSKVSVFQRYRQAGVFFSKTDEQEYNSFESSMNKIINNAKNQIIVVPSSAGLKKKNPT
tara:strand:+ start:1200 stop:1376 length:177 start_codon:yes stop_codon:yes gene_type:complete